MRAHARDLFTGLTALVGVALVVAMLFLFGEFRDFGRHFYDFTIRVDNARGLTPLSAVTLNGVRVGTVEKMANAADPAQGVDLLLRVDANTSIPRDFEVFIDAGLVKSATLELAVSRKAAGAAADPIRAGETVERRALGLIDQLSSRLREPFDRLTTSAGKFDALADTYTEVGKKVSDLLDPRTPADVEGGKPANIPSTIARIDGVAADAHEWLGDGETRRDAQGLVTNASGLVDRAGKAVDSWTEAARTVSARADAAGQKFDQVATDASSALRTTENAASEIQKAVAAVNEGKGTAGMLVNNPDLYLSLADAAKRFERALAEAQLMIEKFRKEGVAIQY